MFNIIFTRIEDILLFKEKLLALFQTHHRNIKGKNSIAVKLNEILKIFAAVKRKL